MSNYTPPWETSSVFAKSVKLNCKKCLREYVEECYSEYSGITYYFCRGCGTDYPDQSSEEDLE